MSKVNIKVKGDVSGKAFAGSMHTNWFRSIGCSQVVIETAQDTILLDWEMPQTYYGQDKTEWDDYIKMMRDNGWKWCASWDYGMFERITTTAKRPSEEDLL